MSKDVSTSLELISQPMERKLPAYPGISFGIIDVRDVAEAHARAMTLPEAAGERFLLGDKLLHFSEIGEVLQAAYPGRKLPKGKMPDWLLKLVSVFNPVVKQVVPELGQHRHFSNDKLRSVLRITPIPAEDAIRASADSLIKVGAIKA